MGIESKVFCTFDRKEKPIKQNLNEKAIFKNRDSGRRIGVYLKFEINT